MKYAMLHVKKDEAGCWNYGGYKSRGYPTIARREPGRKNARFYTAPRYFYQELVGPIPSGMVIRHKCDNRMCVNPDHLELGTQSQNMIDMWTRGRGVRTGAGVTVSKEVRDAALVLARNGAVHTFLAKSLGVSNTTISGWKKKYK